MRRSILVILLFSCSTKEEEIPVEQVDPIPEAIVIPQIKEKDTVNGSESSMTENSTISLLEVKTTHNDTLGYGYEIYKEGKLYIRQPMIPAVSGKHGFRTEADAKKTGEYVKNKIENGIMPPIMTIEELKKLKVI
jgi:Domain of unknown function (DUF4907)